MKFKALLTLSLFFLSACGTRYHSKDLFGRGFSEIKTNRDSFIVTFIGNSYTDPDKIMHYALKRAAELTLSAGYHYFTVVNTLDQSRYTGSDFSDISKEPALSLTIKCSAEPSSNSHQIDAKYFLDNNNL